MGATENGIGASAIPREDQESDWAGLDGPGRRMLLTAILAQVSRDALRSQGLEAVLSSIVECLVQRLPVPVASIILLDADGRHFVQEVAAGEFALDLPSEFPWPVTLGAAGRCARLGEPVLIDDVDRDPDYVPGHRSVRSEFLVPIRHAGRIHGVLNLESTRSDLFTPEFRAVFEAIAEQIAGAVHLALVERELESARRRLAQLSMRDDLTGVGNRSRCEQALTQVWSSARERGKPVALLRVDIDGFGALGETCGRAYGDDCLREVARQCQAITGSDADVVARLANEQLVVVLPDRDLIEARRCAEALRAAVAAVRMSHPGTAPTDHVTVSIGVAVAQVGDQQPEYVLRLADGALRQAKAAGGNRMVVVTA